MLEFKTNIYSIHVNHVTDTCFRMMYRNQKKQKKNKKNINCVIKTNNPAAPSILRIMFSNDPFKIYHNRVNKNIQRMKREKKLTVSSSPMRPTSQRREPSANITTQFNNRQSKSKINKSVTSTRQLLSQFESQPKRKNFIKNYDFKLLENRGLNSKYTRIANEFKKDKKDSLVNKFVGKLETFTNWFRLNRFQYKVEGKDGQESKTKVIRENIIQHTVRSNYIRPEYSKLSTQPTHKIIQVNKLCDFMYVVKVCSDHGEEKIVMLMNIGDHKVEINEKISLRDLCYKMEYKGKSLEVYIRWHLVT